MSAVYAKICSAARFLFALPVLLALAGCGGSGVGGMGSGRVPWDINTGIVTKDRKSMPDIAWQTPGERQVLSRQSEAFARAQTEAESQATPPAPGVVLKPPRKKSTVALLVPLSGKNGELGQAMLKAAQMALFDVGSASVELAPRDTGSGAAAAAKAAVAGGADLILGPVFAEDLRAVKPVAAAAGVPVIAFTTDWTQAGGDTYIMGFLPFGQVARVVKYAEGKGRTRFGVFAPQTEYCDTVISTLRRTGANVARVGRYAPQQTDLSAIVKDFAEKSRLGEAFAFDALLLPVGGEGLRNIMTMLDTEGLNSDKVKMLGTGLWDDAALASQPLLHGGWYAAPDPRLRADFERRYTGNYDAPPPRLASLAYDATALAAVLGHMGGDAPYGRANLTNPRGFAGIDGIFRFRPDGLAERGLAVLEITQAGPRLVDPAPTAFVASGS